LNRKRGGNAAFFMHGCFASHSMVIAVGVHPGVMACFRERRERGPNRACHGRRLCAPT